MRPRPSIPRVVAWVCAGSFRLRNIMIRLDFASRGGRAWRAGVAEGLLTGILASLGCLVAAALGIAIAVFTVHEPNLIPGRQVDRLVIEIEAFAVVPIAVLITLVRRWLRLPPSPISGAIVGLIAALVIVPPMVSLEALPHYFAFIREFAPRARFLLTWWSTGVSGLAGSLLGSISPCLLWPASSSESSGDRLNPLSRGLEVPSSRPPSTA